MDIADNQILQFATTKMINLAFIDRFAGKFENFRGIEEGGVLYSRQKECLGWLCRGPSNRAGGGLGKKRKKTGPFFSGLGGTVGFALGYG